ncbi:hypothetical protein [Nocardia sp. NPDC059691]|uniref:hypothetical protein n=1 Tax=Nocardia sp. NPDC059691 TaxID=3346908 RepID=UPI00368F08B7
MLMPRIVGRRSDGGVVVAAGGVCVIVGSDTLDAAGHCATPPEQLRVMLVSATADDGDCTVTDEPMPAGLLSAAQLATILAWEVGFVEGEPGDSERPGLSSAETELYLRYRPDTGDDYPNRPAVAEVDRPFFSLEPVIVPAPVGPTDAPEFADYASAALVQLCASMAHVDDLSAAEVVGAAAEDLIDRVSYAQTVEEFYPALAQAVSAQTVPDPAVEAADGVDRDEILGFFARLLAELDRRRPWPGPVTVAVDPRTWPTPGSSRLIGWLDIGISALEWAVKAGFAAVPDDDQAVLVLRLRSGQLIALVGEQDPDPARFMVLLPDLDGQQDPVAVIAYLSRYAGLRVEFDERAAAMAEVAAQ